MSYEHKANTGSLFPNKKTADNHPDYKGKIKVGDVEYDLAGWIKKTDNGQFLSLKISTPYKKEETMNEQANTKTGISFF